MDYLKITSRGSIMDCHRELRKPGERFTKANCLELFGGKQEIDRLVGQGYLVLLGEQMDETVLPLPPQIQKSPPHPANIEPRERKMETVAKGDAGRSNVDMTGAEPAQLSIKSNTIITDTGPWNLDPAILKGKDVHELNVMIQERGEGSTIKFETVEEALAWLTQDFILEEANIAVG